MSKELLAELAKTVLRRFYPNVHEMTVIGGKPGLYRVGHLRNVTRDELLAMAGRCSERRAA